MTVGATAAAKSTMLQASATPLLTTDAPLDYAPQFQVSVFLPQHPVESTPTEKVPQQAYVAEALRSVAKLELEGRDNELEEFLQKEPQNGAVKSCTDTPTAN